MEITIQNIAVEVERKPIRNMHLSVYPPDARVHLSMPFFLSESDARSFLLKKWQWICRNREQVLKHNENISPARAIIYSERGICCWLNLLHQVPTP